MAECIIVGNNISSDINNNESNLSFNNDGTFKYPENVTISKNVTSLIDSLKCFREHSEVVSVDFEEGTDLGTISQNCFRDCTNLKKIDLSNAYSSSVGGRLYLGNYAFSGCTNLSELILDEKTWFYYNNGQYAFSNCFTLKKIYNLKTSSEIYGTNVFIGCNNLTNMYVREKYTGNIGNGINVGGISMTIMKIVNNETNVCGDNCPTICQSFH